MSRILDEIGVYGYKLRDENRILGGLLTGDPQLFIGRHGSAKTMLAKELATALYWDDFVGKGDHLPFVAYDASKVAFEDVLGFPNPKALGEGRTEFVRTSTTIWDKEFVFLDEINRADPDMQSKLLELIRSKRVMGYPTNVKFCWAAMNPKGYEGTNDLDQALIGRFAVFNYVQDVLDMTDGVRARVAARVSEDDSPGIVFWLGRSGASTLRDRLKALPGRQPDYASAGRDLKLLMTKAAHQYLVLLEDHGKQEEDRMAKWVARFAQVLKAQSKPKDGEEGEPILLDGRRLGMIRRQILAVRAVHIVRGNLFQDQLGTLRDAAESAVKGSIPTGINAEGGTDATALGIIDKAFKTLEGEFSEGADRRIQEVIYRLTSSEDIFERARLLLTEPLDELTKNAEWTRICGDRKGLDLTVLSFIAQMVEAKNKGTIPVNVISQLAMNVDEQLLRPRIYPLQEQHMAVADQLVGIMEGLEGEGRIAHRLMAAAKVNEFIRSTTEDKATPSENAVKRLRKELEADYERFDSLIKRGAA